MNASVGNLVRRKISLDEVRKLSIDALEASGVSRENARPVAESIVKAEADGLRALGLAYLPHYCQHAHCGKVDGRAVPVVDRVTPAVVTVDAKTGFAHPAIEAGLPFLVEAVAVSGLAALSVTNSYACGALGHLIEPLARNGLVSLAFANAPANIAPWGGKRPIFGTNPLALAVPRNGHDPVIVDQAASQVTKVALLKSIASGQPLPAGWALDSMGRPTCNPQEALKGSMFAAGGHKGVGIALLVEIMAAGLTGANWSFQASSYGNNEGGPPRTGQFLLALSPERFAGTGFANRVEALFSSMSEQDGVQLPSDERWAARRISERDGVELDEDVYSKIMLAFKR